MYDAIMRGLKAFSSGIYLINQVVTIRHLWVGFACKYASE
jgi:hypothetical protein